MNIIKEIEQEAKNISDFLRAPSKLRVFAYLRNNKIEVEEELIIDDDRLYLGTYDQWMTKDEVFEKLNFMTNKAKNLENTL